MGVENRYGECQMDNDFIILFFGFVLLCFTVFPVLLMKYFFKEVPNIEIISNILFLVILIIDALYIFRILNIFPHSFQYH